MNDGIGTRRTEIVDFFVDQTRIDGSQQTELRTATVLSAYVEELIRVRASQDEDRLTEVVKKFSNMTRKVYEFDSTWEIVRRNRLVTVFMEICFEHASDNLILDNALSYIEILVSYRHDDVVRDVIGCGLVRPMVERILGSGRKVECDDDEIAYKAAEILRHVISVSRDALRGEVPREIVDCLYRLAEAAPESRHVCACLGLVTAIEESFGVDINFGMMLTCLCKLMTESDLKDDAHVARYCILSLTVSLGRHTAYIEPITDNGMWQLIGQKTKLYRKRLFEPVTKLVRCARFAVEKEMEKADEPRYAALMSMKRAVADAISSDDVSYVMDKGNMPLRLSAMHFMSRSLRESPEIARHVIRPACHALEMAREGSFDMKRAALVLITSVIEYGSSQVLEQLPEDQIASCFIGALTWDTNDALTSRIIDNIYVYIEKTRATIKGASIIEAFRDEGLIEALEAVLETVNEETTAKITELIAKMNSF